MLKKIIIGLFFLVAVKGIQISGSINADPGKLITVNSGICPVSVLNITINFNVTGVETVDFYVYPAFMTTRCDIISYYYTNLSLIKSNGFNSILSSAISSGMTCFSFQNNYSLDSPVVNYYLNMNCSQSLINLSVYKKTNI